MIPFADMIYSGKPFLGVATIAKLSKIVQPKFRVLEFGAGGSTVWFAERVALIRTHEGSFEVVAKIYHTLEEKGLERKVEFLLNARYPRFVPRFDENTFDLIVVDGRSRLLCLESTIGSLKSGGWVLLDNAEANQDCVAFMDKFKWPREDTRGWRKTAVATFWRKP